MTDHERVDLEQRLAEKIVEIACLKAKIAELEEQIMCEAVVDGLADDAHCAKPIMGTPQLRDFYSPELLKHLSETLFPG